MTPAMWFLDVTLLLLLTARLIRLVVTDDVGVWLVQTPVQHLLGLHRMSYTDHAAAYDRAEAGKVTRPGLAAGTTCPFCIGFWIGALTLLSMWAAGGPGDAADWWRWTAAVFALNYVTAHLTSRLDADHSE